MYLYQGNKTVLQLCSSVKFISYKVDYFNICEIVFYVIILYLPYISVTHMCSSIMFVVHLLQSWYKHLTVSLKSLIGVTVTFLDSLMTLLLLCSLWFSHTFCPYYVKQLCDLWASKMVIFLLSIHFQYTDLGNFLLHHSFSSHMLVHCPSPGQH